MDASSPDPRVLTRYRKREIRAADIELIRAKIAEAGDFGERGVIATSICEAWGWRQPTGKLAMKACRDLLLRLEEWGHIQLPMRRNAGNIGGRKKHPVLPKDLIVLTGLDVRGDVGLSTLVVRPIQADEREGWRLYMDRYHYLGDRPIVGEHLLYAAELGGELVALLGWGSAAFRAPLREEYIGWDESAKRERLHLVANNVRFLVLPWVRVPHLASKILATNLRRLSDDWEQKWGHPVHLAETFVDARFRGTCYRASNWEYLGQTAGRSKRGNAYLKEASPKGLFVYPLRRNARQLLVGERSTTDAVTSPSISSSISAAPCIESSALNPSVAPTSPFVPATPDSAPARLLGKRGGSWTGVAAFAATLAAVDAAENTTSLDLLSSIEKADFKQGASRLAEDTPDAGPATMQSKSSGRRGMNKTRIQIELTDAERATLERQARGLAIPHREVARAKIILRLAAGGTITAAARELGCARRIVYKWGERFVRQRLDGLVDDERSGSPPRFSPRSGISPGQAGLRAPRQRGPLAVAVDLRGASARAGERRGRRDDLTSVGPEDLALAQAQAVASPSLAQLQGAPGCRLSGDCAQHSGALHSTPTAP